MSPQMKKRKNRIPSSKELNHDLPKKMRVIKNHRKDQVIGDRQKGLTRLNYLLFSPLKRLYLKLSRSLLKKLKKKIYLV